MRFLPQRGMVPRDLLDLRLRLGGETGTLEVGGQKVVVLKLGENVFTTTESVKPSIKALAGMEQADIHTVKTHADQVYFAERYRAFKGAVDGQKAKQ